MSEKKLIYVDQNLPFNQQFFRPQHTNEKKKIKPKEKEKTFQNKKPTNYGGKKTNVQITHHKKNWSLSIKNPPFDPKLLELWSPTTIDELDKN